MKVPNVWVTIGKRGFNKDNMALLKQDRISGIRINTGRSTYPWIFETIDVLKEMGIPSDKILLDIGNTKPRLSLVEKKTIDLKEKQLFILSDKKKKGIDAWLPVPLFFEKIEKNDKVYFGDGEIEAIVESTENNDVIMRLTTAGSISDSVSIGIKGKNFFHFYISEKEIEEVNRILDHHPMNLILSFVENGENLKWAQNAFSKALSIIPKIETMEAINNIDSILDFSNCIFIGRGDLGLSIGIEKIGIVQEHLLEKAHEKGCRVSLGTGTLDSMKWSEIPLRAEIVDITNSCLKGVDIIALTSETGGSTTPFKAIDYLMRVLKYVETIN